MIAMIFGRLHGKHKEMVIQRPAVSKTETQPKTASKSPESVNSEDLDNKEEEEPVMKKAPKSAEFVETGPEDSENSGIKDTLRHPLKLP